MPHINIEASGGGGFGADHAFARLGGENYDSAAAELANGRTAEFFSRHLA